ncbi:MAG: TonB-dependent receptor [Allosphingosinicella sp.]|uniref:TonB-dependent receptor n=1 Tax=Allosphingosinicella sp. TaxID=2823234 RepID=UPI0039380A6E
MYRSISALALSAALAAPAYAADAALDLAGDVIVVTGARDEYGARTIRTGTRTDTPLQDVPQAVSVISERQIQDQGLRSIGDVLRYVPGTTIGQGEGHRDQVTLRGNNSTADFFVDGLRDDVQYYRGLYNLQRVEVLKGPNAMIFGRGGGGGVINRVTKQPLFESFTGGSASVDSFGAWYVDADVNQPFAPAAAGRLNAVYEELRNHRDAYEGRRYAVNPTARILFGPDTGFSVGYEYVNDERVVDRGVPAFQGRPVTGFRDTFFGLRGLNDTAFEAHLLRASFEHRFGPGLTLNSRLLYGDYDKYYSNAYPGGVVTLNPAGQRQLTIASYADGFQRENLFSQNDLVWSFGGGAVRHTLLAGIEYGRQKGGNQRFNGTSATILLADPPQIPALAISAAPARSTFSDVDVLALYVQDQIAIGDHLQLIAGLRYDRFDLEVADLVGGGVAARTDDLWSPRLGLVVKPVEPVSLYASYSRSYLPQSGDQFNALDVTAAALEPERFDNYEIGVKWQALPALLVSAAAYRLDRTNTRAPGATPGTVVQTGSQRSRGIEIEAVGEIAPHWNVSAGYTLQKADIRATTSAAPAGREVAQVPRHQASLWTRYDATPRFGAGLGIAHQSKSFASISNAVVLPAYTRVDAALFLRLADGVDAQLNLENLFDEEYFPTAHSDANITTGAPRSVRGTVRFRF